MAMSPGNRSGMCAIYNKWGRKAQANALRFDQAEGSGIFGRVCSNSRFAWGEDLIA